MHWNLAFSFTPTSAHQRNAPHALLMLHRPIRLIKVGSPKIGMNGLAETPSVVYSRYVGLGSSRIHAQNFDRLEGWSLTHRVKKGHMACSR